MKVTFEKGLRLMILLMILAGGAFVFSRSGGPNFNEYQVRATMQKLSCYQDLVDKVQRSEEAQNYLLMLRGKKERGSSDAVTIQQENRLIDTTELNQLLDSYLNKTCRAKLRKDEDFLGLRFIEKDLIVLEVDRFDRRLEGRLSRHTTMEYHRLVFSYSKPDNSKFTHSGEREIIYKEVAEGCFYQVTQYRSMSVGGSF